MRRSIPWFLIVFAALPAFAEADKEEVCGFQGQMTSAIQQARLDGVPEENVEAAVLSGEPTWPENYNAAIPTLAQWVYQTDLGLVEQSDMGAVWQSECIKNWEVIQMTIGN